MMYKTCGRGRVLGLAVVLSCRFRWILHTRIIKVRNENWTHSPCAYHAAASVARHRIKSRPTTRWCSAANSTGSYSGHSSTTGSLCCHWRPLPQNYSILPTLNIPMPSTGWKNRLPDYPVFGSTAVFARPSFSASSGRPVSKISRWSVRDNSTAALEVDRVSGMAVG